MKTAKLKAKNKRVLKVYNFSGQGNYSLTHGWDNGLSCTLGKRTTLEAALEDEAAMTNYNHWSYGLPPVMEKGIFYAEDTYGGSRSVFGYIITFSRSDARKILTEFEGQFEKIDYEREQD